MHQGYIKLWRCIESNLFWLEESFTRGQAWVDLLMLANHAQGTIRRRGIRINIRRGEVGMSLRELAARWKWSIGKVQRFFDELKKEEQINFRTDTENVSVTSLICITNYEKYQPNDTETDTETIRKRVQNKNDKKNKKEKTLEHFENAREIFEKCWAIYPRREGKIEAQKHFNASVQSAEEARELFAAIQIYTRSVADREPEFVKQGSTFFYNWRDYAPNNTNH